jgi:hypothetical protein
VNIFLDAKHEDTQGTPDDTGYGGRLDGQADGNGGPGSVMDDAEMRATVQKRVAALELPHSN